MYRKMQSAQANQIIKEEEEKGVLHMQCVDKVSKLPVVEMVAQQTAEVYDKVKSMSGVTNWTLTTAENTAGTVSHLAELAASKLPAGSVEAVDRTLCSGLAFIEDKVPLFKEQPAEIMNQAKGKVTAVTNYGWNKANDMLNTKWGTIALGGFDSTASIANKYLDMYLPPQEGEAYVPVEENDIVEEDKFGKTLKTVGLLSSKVRSRVYRAVVHQMQGLKQQSEQSVGHVTQILDMKKESAEEEARKLAQNVSTFLAGVPEKVGHLMPTSLAEQVSQAQQYAHQMYEGLLSCTMKDVSDSLKEKAGQVQTALQELGAFASQFVETFKSKNREITEAGAQLAIEG